SVARIFSPARARKIGKRFIATPWQAQLEDYRQYQGFCLPRRARVGWWLNGELALVWRGEIGQMDLVLEHTGPCKRRLYNRKGVVKCCKAMLYIGVTLTLHALAHCNSV